MMCFSTSVILISESVLTIFSIWFTGVHAVSLPWANNVDAYLESLMSDEEGKEIGGEAAVVEHLVCTQPLPSVSPRPLRGVGITRGALLGAPTIVCLCHDDSLLTGRVNI